MDDRLHVCSVRLVCALLILHSLKQLPFHMLRHHAAPIAATWANQPGKGQLVNFKICLMVPSGSLT